MLLCVSGQGCPSYRQASAPLCSLCSPEHKRFRIAWQMPELQTILNYRAWRADAVKGQVFPTPYGEGVPFFHRSAGALGCHTRIRAGFPRDRWSARTLSRDRFSQRPTVRGCRFFTGAGACHRDVERFMKHPLLTEGEIRDREVSPTRKPSRPGGLSYPKEALHFAR